MADVTAATLRVGAEVSEAGQVLNQRAGQMSSELAYLWNRVAALEGTWQGAAHGQYDHYKQLWQTSANGLFGPGGVLPAIAQIMNVVWENYASGEAARKKSWDVG